MGETVDVIVLGKGDGKSSILPLSNIPCRWRIRLRETRWRSIHAARGGIGRSPSRWPGRTQVNASQPTRDRKCSLPHRYSTFVWIGSGLSFADFVWIRSKPWKEFDPRNPPPFLQTVVKANDDKPDVYLEPKE